MAAGQLAVLLLGGGWWGEKEKTGGMGRAQCHCPGTAGTW